MGSLIAKLAFPNRQERRIKYSQRKRSLFGRPSKGRESKLVNTDVIMVPANDDMEAAVGKARTSKTNKTAVPISEGSKGPTFGRGSNKGTKMKLEVTDTLEGYPGTYKKTGAMFGGCIADFVDEEGVNKFVKWSVEAIVSTGEGVRTDALYRASGGHDDISAISKQGEEGMQELLSQEKNVHVLTGALKLFFRDLKEPILNIEHFKDVLEANPEDRETGERLNKVIGDKLCREERATLAFLMLHLASVLTFPENNMSKEGMGVVFGPTLMRPSDDLTNMHADMRRMDKLVQLLLTHGHLVFGPRRPSQLPSSSKRRPPPPPPTSSE